MIYVHVFMYLSVLGYNRHSIRTIIGVYTSVVYFVKAKYKAWFVGMHLKQLTKTNRLQLQYRISCHWST